MTLSRINGVLSTFKTKALSAAAAIGLSGLVAVSGAVPAYALEQITLGTPARVTFSYAPFLMAMELGYFEEEGMEIEVVEFLGTSVLVPQVVNKAVDIGFPSADIVLINAQPGHDRMPVKFFYNAARANIWEFAVLNDSPIRTLEDLRGKRIGIGALANGNVPITRAMMREMGMEHGADYEFVPTGVGAPGIHALVNNDVDLFNGFDAIIANFELNGLDIRRLEQPEKYAGLLSNGFMVHEDTVEQNPELLVRFGRAVTKGIIACEASPEGCVKASWAQYPNLRPSEGTEDEQMAASLAVVGARMQRLLNFNDLGGDRRFGEYSEEVMNNYLDVLHSGDEIQNTDIDVTTLYTNEFVPAYNDFDVDAVVEQARAYDAN